ncbi:methyltransferase domain-containing protein [Cyanobium sp. Cruz-8D1]|nr:methyltransferase domain-containing protein [Cyanobium sp. Cruz-8H5]MCP9868706.1 methyltransferase domain-containing protein [Cyanobium sp. Cruz-8D1]
MSVDLGCGSTIRNPFRAARVIGVDAAITAEGVLTQWVGFQPLNLADSSVDVVTAIDFLQFLPRFLFADGQVHNPFVRALNDVWRILRPDGLFYAETPAHPHASAFANPAHLNVISEDTVQYFARLPNADGQPSAAQALALGRQQGFAGQFQLLDQHWQGTRLCWTLRCEKPTN